jgi:hypothetical protein
MGDIERRTVLGAAWAAPVVAAAATAPAAAASTAVTLFWSSTSIATGAQALLTFSVPSDYEYLGQTHTLSVLRLVSGSPARTLTSTNYARGWEMELAITGERLYWRTVDGLQNEVSVFPIQFDPRDTGAATYYAVVGDNEEENLWTYVSPPITIN